MKAEVLRRGLESLEAQGKPIAIRRILLAGRQVQRCAIQLFQCFEHGAIPLNEEVLGNVQSIAVDSRGRCR